MTEPALTRKSSRLMSLDVFRGATIAAMLLVNNAGDWGNAFPPLLHADWHGCTFTDLIFPFFLFIMGVAMTFSFSKRTSGDGNTGALYIQIIRRTIILFGLGMIIKVFVWQALGHPYAPLGVLQRIALCYLFASIIIMHSSVKGVLAWTLALLAVHYILLKLIPFPGGEAGCLEKFKNIADWFDTRVLGKHLYDYDAALGMGHDAEGLAGTLSAIASTLAGVLCGHWIKDKAKNDYEKVAGMGVAGTILIGLGLLWRYDIPLNKNLWTPPYVVYTTGCALLGLGVFYWVIDIKGWKSWSRPFLWYGVNPITAYFGASLMAYTTVWIKWQDAAGGRVYLKYFLYDHIYKSWVPHLFGHTVSSACWGLTYVVFWGLVMWVMYQKKIIIKV
ncbi:MAG TPA: heparan-alpha-glucosaminide N-acetyltransferase domain-containing protein [Candidatus Sumerlaeota bacterium]|nr:heparan-alpha-glucosaminide N-acetyltransferase domain-containing protein [Candidatus Sumerlaeota bacterium]